MKRKRGRPRKIKEEDEEELAATAALAEPLLAVKVKEEGEGTAGTLEELRDLFSGGDDDDEDDEELELAVSPTHFRLDNVGLYHCQVGFLQTTGVFVYLYGKYYTSAPPRLPKVMFPPLSR